VLDVGQLQVVQDHQRLRPGRAGGRKVAVAMSRLGQVSQRDRLEPRAASAPGDVDRALAGGGVAEPARLVQRVAEADEGDGLGLGRLRRFLLLSRGAP